MIRGYKYLVGNKIGSLFIESCIVKNKRTFLLCKCDCGNEKLIFGYHIKSGKIKSCGCKSKKAFGKMNPSFTGYEEISGTLWRKIKEGALKRNFDFSIDLPYIWELFINQNRKCAISGVSLNFNKGFKIRDGNASLDRIDSSKGYIEGNVQWVDKTINKIKGKLTDEELIKWANIISNFQHNK